MSSYTVLIYYSQLYFCFLDPMFKNTSLHGPRQAEICLRTCQNAQIQIILRRSPCACARSHPGICPSGICLPLIQLYSVQWYCWRQRRSWSDCADAQSDLNLYYPYKFIHSVASNNSVSWQWRLWSDCADAQADLGLRCPHISKETFSHGAAPMVCNIRIVPYAICQKGIHR